MKKVDIYGTIGPACADQTVLTEMFRQGMTGVRLNLSHTELDRCRAWTEKIQSCASSVGKQSRLLIDLQGPELRIGDLRQPLELTDGAFVNLKKAESEGVQPNGQNTDGDWKQRENGIPLPEIVFCHIEKGQEILLDDGKIQLKAAEVEEELVRCRVCRGGCLQSRKSIALPGLSLELPVLTESDKRNIQAARSHGVTGVMLPFVRNSKDLIKLKQELRKANAEELEIFAKIENMEGVEHLEELFPYADQIVIARGDLGNSMPLWELPLVQAEIAEKCRRAKMPFMVVTQMLASMEKHPVPTRAEVSDIFRAVSEGAASVMVTGETAVGKYPTQVIEYLVKTVEAGERYLETY